MLTEKDIDDWVEGINQDYEEKRSLFGFWNIARIILCCTNANREPDGLFERLMLEPEIVKQCDMGNGDLDENTMKIVYKHIKAQPYFEWHKPRAIQDKKEDFMIVDGEKYVIVDA